MFQRLQGRTGHYLLLIAVWAVLCLINLGGPSLWDIDEGNNATCAREMYEKNDWIVPTFNYEFRVAKPAMLYWLQMGAYHAFGVNEFSARLPSALASLASLLILYELGRRMFNVSTGLLAALVLASSIAFTGAAHFANPDALLCTFLLLTLLLFWCDYERGGDRWLHWCGYSTGLAMLTKGPVGLFLPAAIVLLFLVWMGQWKRGFRPTFWKGVLAFLLVSLPWYVWVTLETRGIFFKGFFLQHNFGRYLEPMENHRGPVIYYLVVLLVGSAPWSAFFSITGWHIHRFTRENKGDARYRFLGCWIGVILVFFTVASTKLPNYILPLYPAMALLLAHFLDRWRRGEIVLPAWGMPACLFGLVLSGVIMAGGLIASGSAGETLLRGRNLPGLESVAILGAIPILGALAAGWYLRLQQRRQVLIIVASSAVLWLGAMTAWGIMPVEKSKAAKPLGESVFRDGNNEDLYVASWEYFQPSLVFYAGRKIHKLFSEQDVLNVLDYPVTSYVFMPASRWDQIKPRMKEPYRVLERRRDLYRGIEVVVVCNR